MKWICFIRRLGDDKQVSKPRAAACSIYSMSAEQMRDYATHSNGQDQSHVQETKVGSTPTWLKLALIARQD